MALTEKLTAIADAIRSQNGSAEKLTLDQMAVEISDILNFNVVGNPKPSSPSTNTIWINTDVPITGYDCNANEPANPVDGMVWITAGNSSPGKFNALKKNGITVYPLSAKQRISGVWENKPAQIYQNGAWNDWMMILYNKGDECTDITGGWSAFSCTTDASLNSGGCIKGTDRLTVKTLSSRSSAAFATNNMIDLTPYSFVEFVVPYMKDDCRFGASKYRNTNAWPNMAAVVNIAGGLSNSVVRVDVSNLTGSYYVMFCDWHTAFADETQVAEIRLV